MEDRKNAANEKTDNNKAGEADCVTTFCRANTVLVVKGYFYGNTSETAEDKMERVLKTEAGTIQAVQISAQDLCL